MTATVFSLPRTGYHIECMALSYRIITPLYEPAMPAISCKQHLSKSCIMGPFAFTINLIEFSP